MTTMPEAVRYAILAELAKIHTCLPARIESYEYETQKADVQPVLNKSYTNGESTALPTISNVPVVFPRSGSASLTFPVNEGDYCLLVFSERSLDTWKSLGGLVTPTDPRKFDLSDAIAIVGLMPFNEESNAENNEDVLLSYNDAKIRIKQDGSIEIETEGSNISIAAGGAVQIKTASSVAIGTAAVEVLDVISQTLSALQSLTAVNVPSIPFVGPLANAATFTTIQAQIDSIKGTIT